MIGTALTAMMLLAAFWLARAIGRGGLDGHADRFGERVGRWGPAVAAVVTLIVIWWTWGAVNPLPVIHDEASYVLQADIFARFRWTVPSPPIPAFFEQPYVLVTPAVASMFAPGHALLLAVGSWLHFVPLVPLLLSACAGALIVLIVRRIANVWIASLAWLIWLTTPLVLRYQPGYFSETTTTVAVLLSWWSLLRWRDDRRTRWIVALALALGWGAITRPVTMLPYGIPIGIVVLRDTIRARSWRQLAAACLTVASVLLIIPLWSARTTGDATVIPLLKYTRDYIPFNKPGFSADTSAPLRPLSPVMRSIYDDFLAHHKRHTLARIPRIAFERLGSISFDLWRGTQVMLLPFFLLGLFGMNRELRFAAGSGLLLFATYLTYAYDAPWTLYYLELTTIVATITACGIWRALSELVSVDTDGAMTGARRALSTAVAAIILVAFALPRLSFWRRHHDEINGIRANFEAALRELPASQSIVFFRYANRPHHLSLVLNDADLERKRVWVVHDLGVRNAELLAVAPARTPFVFDEETLTLRRY